MGIFSRKPPVPVETAEHVIERIGMIRPDDNPNFVRWGFILAGDHRMHVIEARNVEYLRHVALAREGDHVLVSFQNDEIVAFRNLTMTGQRPDDDQAAASSSSNASPTEIGTTSNASDMRSFSLPDVPRHLIENPEPGAKTAERVMELLRLRSRIDRIAWNTLGSGRMGASPDPRIDDWPERAMLLVAVGIAFEDMPEVLEHALADPEGTSTHGELLHRAAQAHAHLATVNVPRRWSNGTLDQEWDMLRDAVAGIVGQRPDHQDQ